MVVVVEVVVVVVVVVRVVVPCCRVLLSRRREETKKSGVVRTIGTAITVRCVLPPFLLHSCTLVRVRVLLLRQWWCTVSVLRCYRRRHGDACKTNRCQKTRARACSRALFSSTVPPLVRIHYWGCGVREMYACYTR